MAASQIELIPLDGILDYPFPLRYVWIYSGVTSARLSSPLRVEFFGVPAQALRVLANPALPPSS